MNPIRIELTPQLVAFAQRAESALSRLLPQEHIEPSSLHQAMRYSVLGGGKRIRPMLVYAAGEALNAPLSSLDSAAAAVEIIHAYSLIHDDLPAMDNDDLRRGKPTCHIAFGEAKAILAGDALQALAFEVIAADIALAKRPAFTVKMLHELAHACGSLGMAGGQAFDLNAVGHKLNEFELERMHAHKTGALIRASVRLGALAAGCDDAGALEKLSEYGNCVGLAFQIRDDILDIESDTLTLGKQSGADAALDKPTYPAILGMQRSSELAQSLRQQALKSLQELGLANTQALQDLAHYAVDRNS